MKPERFWCAYCDRAVYGFDRGVGSVTDAHRLTCRKPGPEASVVATSPPRSEERRRVLGSLYIGLPKYADTLAPEYREAARFEALRAKLREEAARTPEPPPRPPQYTPAELWAMHLSAEERIGRMMKKRDRHARPKPADLSWVSRFEPSTSGLGGGFVGVWRLR